MKRILNVWPLAVMAILIFLGVCFGQSSPDGSQNPLTLPSPSGGEGMAVAPDGSGLPAQAMVAFVVPMLLGLLKGFLPIKHRKWIPLLAPVVGELLTTLLNSFGGWGSGTPIGVGAIAGSAGVGVREATKNLKEHVDGVARVIIISGIALTFFTGCQALADKVTRPVITPQTNIVEVVRTNFVPIAVRVPGETVTVTNIVEKLFTNTVERVTTVTNYVAKESIAEGLQVAKTGAAVGGVFNPGAGAIASGALGLASLGLGWMVRRKNNEAVDAQAEAESLALQLEATIRGVETAGIMNPEEGKRVKEAISKFSNALGAQPELHAAVQAITKS